MQIILNSKTDKYLLIALHNQYVLKKFRNKQKGETVEAEDEELELEDGVLLDKDSRQQFSKTFYFLKLSQVISHLVECEIYKEQIKTLEELDSYIRSFAQSIEQQFASKLQSKAVIKEETLNDDE